MERRRIGGWEVQDFTDPFDLNDDLTADGLAWKKTSDVDLVLETAQNESSIEKRRRRRRRRRRGFQTAGEEGLNAQQQRKPVNANTDFVMFFEGFEEANALLISQTSREDDGVAASLLFARCLRECLDYDCGDDDDDDDDDVDTNGEDVGEALETIADGFVPRALLVCHRDVMESESFMVPSLPEDDDNNHRNDHRNNRNSLYESEKYYTDIVAKRVSVKYATTDEDVIKIMSAIHVLPANELPSIIAVCDLSTFSDRAGMHGRCSGGDANMGGNRERLASHTRVCAAIVEAARYATMAKHKALRNLTNDDIWMKSQFQRCKVVVSERKDDMEDVHLLGANKFGEGAGGMDYNFNNNNMNMNMNMNVKRNSFHPLTYATKRWFERVFVVRPKIGNGGEESSLLEVVDCSTNAKATYTRELR
jgi:hypothetical protein